MTYTDINAQNREEWLSETLSNLPNNLKILDAGAGRLRNKPLCSHLIYKSQDFCQLCEYDALGSNTELHTQQIDETLSSRIDYVCDIVNIPVSDNEFDVILCSEVLEHVPDAIKALQELSRVLKPNGKIIITAPFASLVHLAPYHYSSGFSRYFYEYHLPKLGFEIIELTANGDWFTYFYQELRRLGSLARAKGDWAWPFGYLLGFLGAVYFKIRGGQKAADIACFGFHVIARKV